jgi:hypothetical protein
MARGKHSKIGRNEKKCQKYLNEKRRIKNKTKILEMGISKIKKEESINAIIKSCRIGREKEGFKKEEFKFRRKVKQ